MIQLSRRQRWLIGASALIVLALGGTALFAYLRLTVRDPFKRDITGLPEAGGTQVVQLADGATFDLRATMVQKAIGDATVKMFAYNHAGPAVEWEDTMNAMNRASSPSNMFWSLIDTATGAENEAIDWRFTIGERVKLRIVNELDSDHPMQHPFHIHGQRFLILSRDGVANTNLAWKDSVLVATGETVEVLVEMSNPGLWMAHCHIAEHIESGMMLSFRVDNPSGTTQGALGASASQH